jgi:hypothetical protein
VGARRADAAVQDDGFRQQVHGGRRGPRACEAHLTPVLEVDMTWRSDMTRTIVFWNRHVG